MDGKISILQDSEYSLYVRAVRDCEKSQDRGHFPARQNQGKYGIIAAKQPLYLIFMTGRFVPMANWYHFADAS